jgi:hypothetical protein
MALVAKAPQRLANQRRDFCHKEAYKLVQAYDAIYCADLRVRTWLKTTVWPSVSAMRGEARF